jgi:hypothetical protein
MGVRADTYFNDYFSRGDSVPNSGDITITAWCRMAPNSTTLRREVFNMPISKSTSRLGVHDRGSGLWFSSSFNNHAKTDDLWTFHAISWKQSTSTAKWYLREVGGSTVSYTVTGVVADAANLVICQNNVSPIASTFHEVESVKIWAREFTQAEVEAERLYRDAVITSGLWATYRLKTVTADGAGYHDSSGNGRNLTMNGTLVTGSWGSPADIIADSPADPYCYITSALS